MPVRTLNTDRRFSVWRIEGGRIVNNPVRVTAAQAAGFLRELYPNSRDLTEYLSSYNTRRGDIASDPNYVVICVA